MAGHKWSALQRKRYIRTMRLRRERRNAKRFGHPEFIVYRGHVYRHARAVEVVK